MYLQFPLQLATSRAPQGPFKLQSGTVMLDAEDGKVRRNEHWALFTVHIRDLIGHLALAAAAWRVTIGRVVVRRGISRSLYSQGWSWLVRCV